MLFTQLKSIKPFFKFEFRTAADVISLLLGLFVLTILVFRAYCYDITYDEAYSYLNTGRIQNFWKMYQFRIANTHIVNSLLMAISTLFFPYTDFAIRVPNLLTSILYLGIAFTIARQYKLQLLTFGLLTTFHFLLVFMAQGRGYGMSATFILAALFVYKNKSLFKSFHLWIIYLLILAFYSNYVAIAPMVAMLLYLFLNDFKRRIPSLGKKNTSWIVGLIVVGLYGFYSVTREGKPLYGAYQSHFLEAISMEYLNLFWPSHGISLLAVTWLSIGAALIIVTALFLRKEVPFGTMALITFAIIVCMAYVGQKPLPTGRVLLPFWPLVVLAFMELLELALARIKPTAHLLTALNFVLVVPLVYNLQSQLQFQELLSAKNSQWERPLKSLSEYGKTLDPDEIYYLQKDNHHQFLSDKMSRTSFTEKKQGNFTIRKYDEMQLFALTWPTHELPEKVYRKLFAEGEVFYQDTLSLPSKNLLLQATKTGHQLLLPMPHSPADSMVLGDLHQSWEFHIATVPY